MPYPVGQMWITLAVVLLIAGTLAFGRKALLGADKRASTSKTTAFLWTTFVVWVYAVLALLQLTASDKLELPVMSDEYLFLLGGPFAALVAAKGIISSRLARHPAKDHR